MRYKTMVHDKLGQVQNGMKTLKFHAERGELQQYRLKTEEINDLIEQIKGLINTEDQSY